MRYNPEDYEFAIRMLHHRKELDDREVAVWMSDPEHLELLREMAAVRLQAGYGQAVNVEEERRRLHRVMQRRLRMRWIGTAAALAMIVLGAWQIMRTTRAEIPVVAEVRPEITPGDTRAQLILADGRVVDLQASVKEITIAGERFIRNDSVDGLKYQSDVVSPGQQSEEYNVLQVPGGGFYKLELADGTKVWLNAKSELRYPVHFGSEGRHVYLKGEGYFEVTRDEQRPFRVHLEQSTVTVLGTCFNISAYEDESAVYTTLVSGSVEFNSDVNGQRVVLKPGLQSVMDSHSGDIRVKDVDVDLYKAWVDGRFAFRFMDLETIVRQLQRWYDFDIMWRDADVKGQEFRGVIQKDSRIEDVLKAIELTTNVRFRITGKQITVEKK